jgi:hypothetical protein
MFNLVFTLNCDDISNKWSKLEDTREQDQPKELERRRQAYLSSLE